MAEARDRQIVVNIEDTLFEVAHLAARKDNLSASTYLRNLVVEDLLTRGMLSERLLAQVIKG